MEDRSSIMTEAAAESHRASLELSSAEGGPGSTFIWSDTTVRKVVMTQAALPQANGAVLTLERQ